MFKEKFTVKKEVWLPSRHC